MLSLVKFVLLNKNQIMKKQLLSTLFFAVGVFGLNAQTLHPVTISVNMSNEMVGPNGVHVAGSFQSEIGVVDGMGNPADWQAGATMMTENGGGIYTFEANLPDGIYEYKFINGNAWGSDEGSIPSICQVGGGNTNRFFVVDGFDVFLPPVYFNGSSASDNGTDFFVPIRFSTDMGPTIIAAEGVSCRGNWQEVANAGFNFSADASNKNKLYDLSPGVGLNVYTGIFYVPSTSPSFEYKFVNGVNYENVPSECVVGLNRSITADPTNGTSVLFCFGTCNDVCVVVPTYTLTLNVDMNYSCSFDVNSNDSVDIAGTFNSFQGGPAYLMSDLDNDGIYSITLTNIPEGEVKYKARIIRNANFGSGWEGGGDKVIQLSSDSTMAPRCFSFDVAGLCAPIPAPSDVTFRVDMTSETPASSIYLIGDFTTPPYQGGAILLTQVSNGIYETTVNDICPGKINFKFVNGPVSVSANEESFPNADDRDCVEPNGIGGFNRVLVRQDANPTTLYYKFNSCQEILGLSDLVSEKTLIFPNPADQTTLVQFSNTNETYTVSVFNILGKRVRQSNNLRSSFAIQREGLSSGIYFVQITDSKGQTSTQKLTFR
jgi:hypothetical protein